ncbi:hypothetical protein QVD17_04909 [Tagetes erecta]|uniref:Uncharacterized protein n=1 Tax=Tagetes erecta TaxID=13708 RepID=A0AAD8LB09_TARER|nr:hypothetical protein QVD17_04909 [Tagetes erecta]
MAGAPDLLFGLRNNFYIGAFQAAVNNGDFQNLSEEDAIERDCLIYRSYIILGSYQAEILIVDKIHELLDLIRNQLHCSGLTCASSKKDGREINLLLKFTLNELSLNAISIIGVKFEKSTFVQRTASDEYVVYQLMKKLDSELKDGFDIGTISFGIDFFFVRKADMGFYR